MRNVSRGVRLKSLDWVAFLLVVLVPQCCILPARTQTAPPLDPGVFFLQVSLGNWLDAGSLRIGRSFTATALSETDMPSCTIPKYGKIYGHVVQVEKTSRMSRTSSMALAFDAADCFRKGKLSLRLWLVEVIGTETAAHEPLRSAIPLGMNGRGRQIDSVDRDVVAQDLDRPGEKEPAGVQPGAVLRMAHVALQLGAGPGGASKLTASNRNVRLVPHVTLILASKNLAPVLVKFHASN
jgi:hypothetical protein